MEYGIMYLAVILVIAAMSATLWLFFRRLRQIEKERWGKDPDILHKFMTRKAPKKAVVVSAEREKPSDKPQA